MKCTEIPVSHTSAKLFHDLLVEMNRHFKHPSGAATLAASGFANDFADLISTIVNLDPDAKDEAFRAIFPDEQRSLELAAHLDAA
jgi:hypothetical protein